MKFVIILKKVAYFLARSIFFCLHTKSLLISNLKTKMAMNAKLSRFVVYFKAIIYLLLYSLNECTLKSGGHYAFNPQTNIMNEKGK